MIFYISNSEGEINLFIHIFEHNKSFMMQTRFDEIINDTTDDIIDIIRKDKF